MTLPQSLALAQQHLQSGEPARAVAVLRQAMPGAPASFELHAMLGAAHHALGDLPVSVSHLRAALRARPNWVDGHALLGTLLARLGRFDEAAAAYAEVLRLRPDNVEAHNNLGTVLKAINRRTEAIHHLRTAAALRPDQAEVFNNLGNALLEEGQTVEAVAAFQRAVELRPGYAELYGGLASGLAAVRRVPEAVEALRTAVRLNPQLHPFHSSLLYILHYLPAADEQPAALAEEHLQYARQHAVTRPPAALSRFDRSADRPLRVGYVSADFRRHSVAHFIEPILAGHDPAQFEVFCYADVCNPDDVTVRLQTYTVHWRNTFGITDERLVERVRNDRIDVLVDLAGHTGGGRMMLFSRRVAPVQVTYLGYPDTTGLPTMDWRVTDAIADPPGDADVRHTERLARLPPPFLCYAPPLDAPPVTPPPVRRNGYVTFGSFNALPKLSSTTVELWARVLRAVPGSRLLVKARGLQQAEVVASLAATFAEQDVSPDRLLTSGNEDQFADHLARYGDVDVALDPTPYNGTTTTCEALWMGVPVVTLAGHIHAARVGATLLAAIDRPRWIATTADEYVAVAGRLAATAVDADRPGLRAAVRASPLMDAAGFTRRWERALRDAWRVRVAAVQV